MATILVVDDEFAIVDLLEMVLVDEGHLVLTAANGRQALERLAQHPRPDLIISDYMMPILNGASMLEAMRNIDTQRAIPCIMMSSMPEQNVRQRVGDLTAFIRKPFNLVDVIELVARVLSASQASP
jgi:CheY-like chemotaxis protein